MSQKYFKENQWWVSPYNFVEDVISSISYPKDVIIHDATLRDGEQTPGVVFSIEDKVQIAKALDKAGVGRIEAGMPAVSYEDYRAIEKIATLGLKAKIFTFARAMNEDIDKAIECGADGVIIEVPIGYPKLKYQFKWTWEDVVKRVAPTINYAKLKGLYTVFFPYDATRAKLEDLEIILNTIMKESPPDSIGLVDTMGCATPEAMSFLVKKYRAITGVPIEVHSHNDFGMAVASELAGVGAGASVVHSCVNGLGERTGNAALEELVVALEILYGVNTGCDIEALTELSKLVEELSGINVSRNKPVVGEENYTRESGIGVNLVVENPLVMFATHPNLTGKHGKIVLGKKSGKPSIVYKLKELGLEEKNDEQLSFILSEVKRLGTEKKGLVTDEEFLNILKNSN